MADTLLRLYGPDELEPDGYPIMWHRGEYPVPMMGGVTDAPPDPGIKEIIREEAGYRCERCGHPYPPGITAAYPRGEWTPCDEQCTHGDPRRVDYDDYPGTGGARRIVEAQWRILTTHHLNGVKWDCRWWNLAALCQRCHLEIQARVVMERVYPWEHSEWFKPHAAGWYASAYLHEDLTREETMARLPELLALEQQHGWTRI